MQYYYYGSLLPFCHCNALVCYREWRWRWTTKATSWWSECPSVTCTWRAPVRVKRPASVQKYWSCPTVPWSQRNPSRYDQLLRAWQHFVHARDENEYDSGDRWTDFGFRTKNPWKENVLNVLFHLHSHYCSISEIVLQYSVCPNDISRHNISRPNICLDITL